MTRDEWLSKCSGHYQFRGQLSQLAADEAAETCAQIEEQEHGVYDPVTNPASKWTDPIEAADNDMDDWGNDDN